MLASLAATLVPMFFICFLVSDYTYYGEYFDMTDWHIHEMLFGFTSALLSGFILTAGAHWANTESYGIKAILPLSLLWVLERLALFYPFFSKQITFSFGVLFSLLLLILVVNLVRKNRKISFALGVFFTVFGLSKFLFSWGALVENVAYTETGKVIALGLIRVIIAAVAGKVIPFFLSKKAPKAFEEIPFKLNLLCVIPLILLIPYPYYPVSIQVFLSLFCLITNLYRYMRWKPLHTRKFPMLWILYVAYAFMLLHLLSLALEPFFPILLNGTITTHLLTSGLLGIMGLGIMGRVVLGHTGREIRADRWMIFMYLATLLGAVMRVLIPLIAFDHYYPALHSTMGFWTLGYLVFFFRFFKTLVTPRI